MQESSLKKRYVIKLFANIINILLNAIIIAIIPKALGPVYYGQFVYLQDFFNKTISFLDMGSSMAFFIKLSARHDRKELITFYFLYSFIVLCLILSFVYMSDIFSFIHYIIPDISLEYIYMALVLGFFTWFTQIFIKISDAYALTVSVELIKIGHKVLSLLLLLFFVYQLAFDLKLFFYFHYIALITFLLIISWLFIKKEIFKNILNSQFSILKLSKEFIIYCHPLLVYSIIGFVAGLFDIWLLQKVTGSEQMGFYGLAYSLAAMCFLFTSAMTPIITREFSKSYEQKDLEAMRKLFYRYIPMLYSIATYFSVFISVQSENVLMIFTDEKFKDAFLVLVIMALYPIHQTYGQLSGSIFYATGQTKLMRNIALFTMPLGIVISFIFIYLLDLGAVGLAYKMLIGQVIGVNIQLYFNARFLNLKLKYFLWHQIYSIFSFVILAYIASNILVFNVSLFDFLFSGFLYTILVIIFVYIFPQVFAIKRDEIDSLIINFVKKYN
ncbi:MAG: oligosaccharide flippase family protein [Candidatus Marinarcus sp.]|uniref:oligosaccharide flippase family protein n=1 Tax=Candidatus Marinarcus sp. TaxID=3100987 RepID=UPI003B00CA1A